MTRNETLYKLILNDNVMAAVSGIVRDPSMLYETVDEFVNEATREKVLRVRRSGPGDHLSGKQSKKVVSNG